jgi:hypothetical protein
VSQRAKHVLLTSNNNGLDYPLEVSTSVLICNNT